MTTAATLVPSDGIGPEVTSAMVEILRSVGAAFEWHLLVGGTEAFRESGDALPEAMVATVRELGLALKGPLKVPLRGYEDPNRGLRQGSKATRCAADCGTTA